MGLKSFSCFGLVTLGRGVICALFQKFGKFPVKSMVFTISCIGMQRSSHPSWDNQVGKSSLDVALLLSSFFIISLISPMLRGCNGVSSDTSELVSSTVTGSGPAARSPPTLLKYVFSLSLSCLLFSLTPSTTVCSGILQDCLLVICLTKSHHCLVFCWLLSFSLIYRCLLDRTAFCTRDLRNLKVLREKKSV